jgi:DeoR family fructose operon transcriptional repressor
VHLSSSLATEDRRAWLRRELDRVGRLALGAAASQLGVSEMTVRRDLQELEAMGFARRVRGGAVAVGPVSFADRHRQRARAKAVIAGKLVRLLPETGAVAVDASSTLARLAAVMPPVRDLTVVTNGLTTFNQLQGPGVSPVLTGGTLDERTGSLVGPIAVRSAGQYLTSRFFMSAAAFDATAGASESGIAEAEVKRAFQASTREVILAVDSSKLDQRAVAVSATWSEVHLLVTELPATHPKLRGLSELVEIL